jgi:NADH-quinone oxidoreductase subunit A
MFAVTPLILAALWAKKFSPKKSGPIKNAVYECGLESETKDWVQFKSDYYLYGIIFLGSAVYFAYGLYRPVWGNAKGQLVGFLAYDLVLIVPFVRLWQVSPSLSLAIYLAVIVASALLAIGFLLVSPTYRLWSKAEGA